METVVAVALGFALAGLIGLLEVLAISTIIVQREGFSKRSVVNQAYILGCRTAVKILSYLLVTIAAVLSGGFMLHSAFGIF